MHPPICHIFMSKKKTGDKSGFGDKSDFGDKPGEMWQIGWFSTLDAKNVRMENISLSSPICSRRLTLIYMKYWETCWELYWRLGVYKSKKSREKNTPNRRRLGDLSSTGRPNPDQWDPAKDPNRPQKFFDVHFSIHLSLRTGGATHEGSFLIFFSKYHSVWMGVKIYPP